VSGVSGFTPLTSLAGGALIGASASALLLLDGRIAGISGIVGGLVTPQRGEVAWRALFVGGLLVGALLLACLAPGSFQAPRSSWPVLAVGGLLVGVGTSLASGCTSGHGVCGLSRFSPRSLAATITFVAFGIATATIVHRLLGVPG
jgi:uncharacterized membrane protein YedE/YeeE